MEKRFLSWIDTLYQWANNTFTWNDVAEFINVTNAIAGSGIDLFSPQIKREVRKVATPEQQEIFVKVVSQVNGKFGVLKKKKSTLSLKDVTVKEIHRAFEALSVKIKVHKP